MISTGCTFFSSGVYASEEGEWDTTSRSRLLPLSQHATTVISWLDRLAYSLSALQPRIHVLHLLHVHLHVPTRNSIPTGAHQNNVTRPYSETVSIMKVSTRLLRGGLDFSNTREAYRSKTFRELLRHFLVYKVFSYTPVVENSQKVNSQSSTLSLSILC